ncbi:MAG: hypothetical protein ACJ75Z_01005 [Solirubrobacterales bacterium]
MGAFAGTYLSAGVILLASLLVGRALLLLLGRRTATFLEGAVGIAFLMVVESVAIRLPGHEKTSAVIGSVLVIASVIFLVLRRESIFGPAFFIALPVALLALLIASFPFIASGHIGIPGVGLNNDMASHLIYAEYLLDPSRLKPPGIQIGYPIGPHSLATTVATMLGSEPLRGFLGLLVALPVLMGITSLALLRELPVGRRILAAALVSGAYLTASVLGIAGFKELLAGMFLIAFALGLREIERSEEGRVAIVIGLAVISAGMVSGYSYPGAIWLGITLAVWIVAELARASIDGPPGAARDLIRRARPIALPALAVLVVLGLILLPRAIDFARSGAWHTITGTNSKLRFVVSPLESLGVWPSGDWLAGTHDVSSYWIFGAVGLAALAFAVVWWIGRRDLALPSALIAGIAVYLGTQIVDTGLYVQAKAVILPASLVMLMVTFALFAPGGGWPRRIFAAVFVALAAYSSFLALRDAVIAPDNRFGELQSFRDDVDGQRVLSLTSDRFADYGLRTAEVFSPAANAEYRVDPQVTKSQRLPIDFDSVPARVLNEFPYAVTTSAIYQSQAPPGWTLVRSTDSYKLWKRTGTTPPIAILYEEARPGRVFRCNRSKLAPFQRAGGTALTWQPRPQIAKRLYWKAGSSGGVLAEGSQAANKQARIDNSLAPGETASQQIKLPPGQWVLSIQYVSPVTGIQVRAPGLETSLPAGVDAAIPYRPDQGPYWPVGEIATRGGPVTFSVRADDVDWFQKLLGVDAPAVIGNLTAVSANGFVSVPTASACTLYVDHLIDARQFRNTQSGAK